MKNIFSIILIFCSIEIYSQSWNIETTLPGEYNRRAGISAVVGNKAYTGLGIASNFNSGYGENTVADFWSYDMNSKTWAQLPSFPGGGRCDAAAFVIGTKIYVGGGDVNVKFTNPNQGLYASEFATVTKKWSDLGKELFTTADNYILQISSEVPADSPLRKLILSAVMCIDLVLKE